MFDILSQECFRHLNIRRAKAVDYITDHTAPARCRRWQAPDLLAMIDYLSRINNIPICTRYSDLRLSKLKKPIFPIGVLLRSEVLHSDEPLRIAEEVAIPEFKRFNIIESEVRNVV